MTTRELPATKALPSAGLVQTAPDARRLLDRPTREFARVVDRALRPNSAVARPDLHRPASESAPDTNRKPNASGRRPAAVTSPEESPPSEETEVCAGAHHPDDDRTELPANVIPFPGLPVIIPFPDPRVDEPRLQSAGQWAIDSENTDEAAVEIDVVWPGWPRKPNQPSAANIERVDFDGSSRVIVPVAFRVLSQGGPGPALSLSKGLSDAEAGQAALTDLPGSEPGGAKSAALSSAGVISDPGGEVAQPRLAVALGAVASGFAGVLGPAGKAGGITAAPSAPDMDTLHEANTFIDGHQKALDELDGIPVTVKVSDEERPDISSRSPSATDWQMGRPVGLPDRPAPVPSDSGSGASSQDLSVTVERLSQLVLRETALVRQHGVMAVLLRPDADTELFVHFSQKNGHIQATVRCERGDFQQLNTLWPQLQEALALQKVRLAPLQESSTAQPELHHLPGSGGDAGQAGPGHDSERSPWRERGDLGLDHPRGEGRDTESALPRGGRDTRPRPAGRRPGWETWA